jgi:hypothetical protein
MSFRNRWREVCVANIKSLGSREGSPGPLPVHGRYALVPGAGRGSGGYFLRKGRRSGSRTGGIILFRELCYERRLE